MAWPAPDRPRLRKLAWFGALVLMLSMLGTPPVQRTQEARVLETAREMLGKGFRNWMIPHLNGQVRLQKPPLAYWLAAVCFKLSGTVNEFAGRLPFAVAGWITLLITWTIAREVFGRRAAFYAGAALLGGWMFARHARLAETDILATLFVTAATGCIWRGARDKSAKSYNWMAASGAMIGLAVLAKGPPAIFAVVFLFALAAVERDEQILLRWLLSGAPLIAAVVTVPWFLYVHSTEGLRTLEDEAEIATRGGPHAASVFQYAPQTLLAVTPWTALAVLALVVSITRWRDDARVRMTLLWLGAVIVPLCIARQRQFHYLLPAMPAFALLTGWLIDQTLDRDLREGGLVHMLFVATVIVAGVGALALPIIGSRIRGGMLPVDWLAMVLCAAGAAMPLVVLRRGQPLERSTFAFAVAAAVGLTVLMQAWAPSLRPVSPRTIAADIRAVGPGPYFFYGENASMPLVFYIGEVMPQMETPDELRKAVAQQPDAIVVAQTKSGKSPPPVPESLERAVEIDAGEQTFEVYRVRR